MRNENDLLPRPGQRLYLTDGGLETSLIFYHDIDLPEFASFVVFRNEDDTEVLRNYYRRYLDIAARTGSGFILESATWRASRDWGAKIGYDEPALAEANRIAVKVMKELRAEYAASDIPIVVSGNVGPRGDGYVAGAQMTGDEAKTYHQWQIRVLADAGVDVITAMTMTYPAEAIGIVLAAAECGLPSVIGFTTETDGRLPNGASLEEAIQAVDEASEGGPAYYMVNCAHTDHFSDALDEAQSWTARIGGIRANASRLSHAELDEAEVLDDGDPIEFGQLHRRLRNRHPHISVFGGCCGTDHRHVQSVCAALA